MSQLRGDMQAGITTAVMLVPQAMAYAMLAGLPPVHGLYAAILPLVAYAAFGSSPVLAVGPTALESLLVAAGVGALALAGIDAYLQAVFLLTVVVGILQVVFGLLRLGFLVHFLSRPVLTGFIAAAALTIIISQMRHFLGVAPTGGHTLVVFWSSILMLPQTHVPTLLLATVSFLVLVLGKRISSMFPWALLVVVVSAALAWGFDLAEVGIAMVGTVPAGLPGLTVFPVEWSTFQALLPAALTITLVAFVEAYSISKKFERQCDYVVNPDREFGAIGAANIAAGFSGGFVVGGGLSRSAVHVDAGAKTRFAGVVTAATVLVVLLWLTPALQYVPLSVLAAIIVAAAGSLLDIAGMKRLLKVKQADFWLLLITFLATLLIGIQYGLLIGVTASLLWFVGKTSRPHTAVLGRLPGTEDYRNVLNNPEAETFPGVLIIRMDAQFYFGNVAFLKKTLASLEAQMDVPLRVVIMDASSMNQMDSSADEALHDICRDYRERGIRLLLANVKMPVKCVMDASGLRALIGEDRFFMNVQDAVDDALAAGSKGDFCADTQ